MSRVKIWLEEVWEVEDILVKGHPFSQDEIQNIALERLQWGIAKVRESEKFPYLAKLNAYLAGRSMSHS